MLFLAGFSFPPALLGHNFSLGCHKDTNPCVSLLWFILKMLQSFLCPVLFWVELSSLNSVTNKKDKCSCIHSANTYWVTTTAVSYCGLNMNCLPEAHVLKAWLPKLVDPVLESNWIIRTLSQSVDPVIERQLDHQDPEPISEFICRWILILGY